MKTFLQVKFCPQNAKEFTKLWIPLHEFGGWQSEVSGSITLGHQILAICRSFLFSDTWRDIAVRSLLDDLQEVCFIFKSQNLKYLELRIQL